MVPKAEKTRVAVATNSTQKFRMLSGTRVLDLTRFLSGPQATLFLGALGAEVVRIDDPATGDPTADAPPYFGPKGISLYRQTASDLGIAYLKRARGKKAITLNLKSERGRALFFRLVDTADVVVENFRVGVTQRLGIDYPVLRKRNPRLIHCAITGYGSTGPDRALKAFDLMVQAATGLMSITGGVDDGACKTGSPLSDGIAGTFAVTGILGALIQRERTGMGQFIDVSMSDCLLSLILDEPLDCYERLGLPLRQGNRIMRFSPFNTYVARDGMVAIGTATRDEWVALVEIMGRTDLLADPDFMNPSWRIANNSKVDEVVSAWAEKQSTSDILVRLTARQVPCSRIRTISDVVAWPHLHERGMLTKLRHPGFAANESPIAPAFPIKFSEASTEYESSVPLTGQHNDEIYRGLLGMSDGEIQELANSGAI
jgi:formyl-CoA transferase